MAGTLMMVSALVSAATIDRPIAHRAPFCAEEVVSGVVLVFPEPHAEPDDAEQIGEYDGPVAGVEVSVHQIKSALLLGNGRDDGQQIRQTRDIHLARIPGSHQDSQMLTS